MKRIVLFLFFSLVLIDLAKAQDNVARHLDGKSVVKEIVVPNKLVNIVVR